MSSPPGDSSLLNFYHPFATQGPDDKAYEFQAGVRTFSGTDIQVYIFLPLVEKYNLLGSLKMLSWGTTRTKSLVTTLGRASGVGYTRGVRVITGALAFLQLDRTAFVPLINKDYKRAASHPYKYTTLPDELPPFDLLLTFVSETGSASYMIIKHVEIVQSQGMNSIDETNPSEIYSFVALGITPLIPLTPIRSRPPDLPIAGEFAINGSVTPEGINPIQAGAKYPGLDQNSLIDNVIEFLHPAVPFPSLFSNVTSTTPILSDVVTPPG